MGLAIARPPTPSTTLVTRHLEREYAAPDYHSAVHAADVVQAVAFVLADAGGGLICGGHLRNRINEFELVESRF